MKKISLLILGSMVALATAFTSCKKSSGSETSTISTPPLQIGAAISSSTVGVANTQTAVKGTMLTSVGTYNVVGDIVVNIGDTLYLQPGVTLCVQNKATIIVKGAFISLGTQTQPNTITACSLTPVNTIAQGENPATDPAYSGGWTGINCDTSAVLCCLKWTHVNFFGAAFSVTEPFVGGTAGTASWAILFQNVKGNLIVEDSWFYGGTDDCIRIQYGNMHIMRNTFEKNGNGSGDVLNAKSGAVGDMAYNLIVGGCTNGTKASNKGTQVNECNVNMYNNTYINCGYRQAGPTGRSGSIDYEQGAEGYCYNNLIVNCRTGMRIDFNPVADTTHCHYGYNYAYSDSVANCNQFYPPANYTQSYAYIFPTAAQAFAAGYTYSGALGTSVYNGAAWAATGSPMFVNFPLPEQGITHLYDISYASGFNFHLQSGSPCIGKGFTGFTALHTVTVTKAPFAPTVTQPGVDIGAYQANGSGNAH